MRISAVTLLLLLAAFIPTASARDIFVDNVRGDDHYRGTTPQLAGTGGGPVRTITHALRIAEEGDRIVLAATGIPYRESITLEGFRHSGSPRYPFVLAGNGAVLDGSLPVREDAWEHFDGDVFRFQPPRMAHQQLFRDDRPLVRVPLDNGNLQVPKLQPLEWCLLDGYIYFRVEKDKLPQAYALSHAGGTVGITLYDVRNVMVFDLIVQGFQLDGINAHDKAFATTIAGVVCRGNGRSGFSVGGSSRVTLQECVAGDNGSAQVRTEGYSQTWIDNCELLANTAPAVVREGGDVRINGQAMAGDVINDDVLPAAAGAQKE